jgi:hypothetical protein
VRLHGHFRVRKRNPSMFLDHRRRKNGLNRPGTSKARTLLFFCTVAFPAVGGCYHTVKLQANTDGFDPLPAFLGAIHGATAPLVRVGAVEHP